MKESKLIFVGIGHLGGERDKHSRETTYDHALLIWQLAQMPPEVFYLKKAQIAAAMDVEL